MLISQYRVKLNACLRDNGVESYVAQARILMGNILSMPPLEVGITKDRELTEEEYCRLEDGKTRLINNEPIQYITGTESFLGLDLDVGKGVLIPRPETEELAMLAIECAKKKERPRILDLCCGSGALACGIKHSLKNADVYASDISDDAIRYTRINSEKHSADIEIIKSDMFTSIDGSFDIIVSNPPYITEEEYAGLDKNVKDYEPQTALVGGRDGLDFYRIIASEAPEHLKDGGVLLLEIGNRQGIDVKDLIQPFFMEVQVIKDMFGNDRIVKALYTEVSGGK